MTELGGAGVATADTATASSTAGSTADVQASGGVVGALKAIHILQPWLGAACAVVAMAVITWLWWRRTRHLPWTRQLIVPAAGAASAVTFWLVVDVIWHPIADGVGWFVWTWVGVIGLVIAQLVTGNRTEGRHRAVRSRNRRLVRATESASSLVAVVASSLLAINTFFASYPTLASVLGYGVATTPLNRLQGAAARSPAPVRGRGMLEETWRPPSDMPARGQAVTADIPAGDQSGTKGFTPRGAFIYLPPAYLGSQRPALPVLVLLTGQPGSPSDWFELGGLKDTMDAYAADHHGLAPVVVVADLLGSPYANPLCSDTEAGGKVATYLEKDVPAWIRANLQVDDDPAHWAVAGLSNGGTCAMQVVTRSPGVYRTFLAISAEEHPTLGSVERTISQGFGGDRAAYEANDPLSLMSTAPPGRYDGIAGILSVGRQDTSYRGAVPVLAEAATKSGMTVSTRQYDGAHTWAVWGPALADQVDWLGRRLGIASPSPAS